MVIFEYEKVELRKAIRQLDEKNNRIITLRYWHYNTIEEIAMKMKMKWADVDRAIEQTIAELRVLMKVPNQGGIVQ